MQCVGCGSWIGEHDAFCPRCGRSTTRPLPAPEARQQPPSWQFQPGDGGSAAPWMPPPSAPPARRTWPIVVAAVAAFVLLAAGVTGYLVWHGSTPTRPTGVAAPASTSTSSSTSSSSTSSSSTSPSAPAPSSPTPSAALSFADLYAQEHDGVVRIETVGCSDGGVGTGFLLSPTLVATVAHVVDQATVISLQTADRRTTGP